ncbi:MAG TPA: SPOR domain-containing protein [Bacteroidia bacterium]|nr:SPOR domain-containing protein [Bacteroidia bacterium]HNT79447.1 SPOR domain-containing protein [Bacteroidia bacterium]
MKVEKSISELLFHHDCVIVHNFGGFVANYKSAHLHPAHHLFYPPSKKIAFNAGLKNNDGLLASHLAQQLDITYNEALNFIDHFVRDANILLQQGKKIYIQKVGCLYLDKEKHIQFEADNTQNFLLDSFGLEPIHAPAIRRENLHHSIQKIKQPTVRKLKHKRPAKKLWRIIELAPAAALLAFMFFNPVSISKVDVMLSDLNPFSKPYYPSIEERVQKIKAQQKAYYAQNNEVPETNNSAILESEPIQQQEPKSELLPDYLSNDDLNKESTFEESNTPIPAEPNNKAENDPIEIEEGEQISTPYFIVTGCFKSIDNADSFVNDLKAKGHNAKVVAHRNGMHVVGIAYPSKSAAENNLPQISDQYDGAWIFKK